MSSDEIDPALLPSRMLLDTMVLIMALGDRPKQPSAAVCRKLFRAAVDAKKELMIAAPSYAELLRGAKNPDKPPLVKNVNILSFDEVAARRLGTDFPEDTLLRFAKAGGDPLHYFKYDAMIIACAVRWGVNAVVTSDKNMIELAKKVGLRAAAPEDYLRKQKTLGLEAPPEPVE